MGELGYHGLLKARQDLYTNESSPFVKKVPFGRFIKECARSSQENEPTVLNMVHKYASVPAPPLVDILSDKGGFFMVMTKESESQRHPTNLLMEGIRCLQEQCMGFRISSPWGIW